MKKVTTKYRWGPEADFLVIGSGIAGLRAAIELCRHGRVLIVTKGSRLESNSIYAQGGVAVALNAEDDVNLHFSDTIRAGHQLGREEAARILVEEGPTRIQELITWGTQFDKVGGKFVFTKEGAHSRNRVLRARGDATGNEMIRVLLERARQHPDIQWFDRHFTKDLLVVDGRCCGAVVVSETTGDVKLLPAAAVILTTGGAGQMYARTTNTGNATGDGMAMAYRAGVVLEDMEFVQFHPTALYLPSSPPFLLSEAMRGEGGVLRNRKGEVFLSRYHPAAEMASRDIVARAIWSEMAASPVAPRVLGRHPFGERLHQETLPDDLSDLPAVRHRYHGGMDSGCSKRPLFHGRPESGDRWGDHLARPACRRGSGLQRGTRGESFGEQFVVGRAGLRIPCRQVGSVPSGGPKAGAPEKSGRTVCRGTGRRVGRQRKTQETPYAG